MSGDIMTREQNRHHRAFWSHKRREAEREQQLAKCNHCGDWHVAAHSCNLEEGRA